VDQPVRRPPLTAEERARSGNVSRDIYVGKSCTEPRFAQGTSLYFPFPLSVSFHECFILIFINLLLLSEERTSDAWKLLTTKQRFIIRCQENAGQNIVVPTGAWGRSSTKLSADGHGGRRILSPQF